MNNSSNENQGPYTGSEGHAPEYYVEEETVILSEHILRVRGWSADQTDTDPVEINFYDGKHNLLKSQIRRFERPDVGEVYPHLKNSPLAGFYAEITELKDSFVVLEMKNKEGMISSYRICVHPLYIKTRTGKRFLGKCVRTLQANGIAGTAKKGYEKLKNRRMIPLPYMKWREHYLPSAQELARQRNARFEREPLISVVVPLYKTEELWLRQLIASIEKQTYRNWQLCLSDGSGENSPLSGLLDEYEKKDSRIVVIRNNQQLHISENTNKAIEAADGEYIMFSDHDDLITENALYEVVKTINEHPDAEIIYTDEDKVSSAGTEFMEPQFKPDFNRDLLNTVNYICHLFIARKTLLDEVGYLRPEYDGAQDYDLILRCTERTDHIYHIPKILYHWRAIENSTSINPESKTYAFQAGERALNEHFRRINVPAHVYPGEFPGLYRTKYEWKEQPLISIIIPNKDHIDDLDRCISSIEEKSIYRNYEYIIVENNSTEKETFVYYEKLKTENPKVKVVYFEGPFNYSEINNFGASCANGEYFLLLNNDTEVISENWMEEMLGYCMRDDVGIVGARLYFEDDTVQHAGVVIGFGEVAGHCFVMQPRVNTGYCHRIISAQNYTAVTAACMMVKRTVFEQVEGLSTDLAVAFNDIDFCLKVRHAGYLVVYNPYVELYHYESKSRGQEDTPEKIERFRGEIATIHKHWPEVFRNPDPYYNPNLTRVSQDFCLKRIWENE